MANYIGNQPLNGEFKVLDSIESQFNNSSTSFGLKYNTASQTVGDAAQLIVSLNGVIQQPLTSYTLSGVTNIVFSSPPSSGDTCFIILLGGIGGTVTPSDNSVTTEKLTNSSVTSAKIVNNTITADDMDSSDSYAFAGVNVGSTFVTDTVNDRIGVGTTNPTYPLDVEDDGAGFIKGSFVSTGSAHSTITFDNTGSDAASVRVGSNNNDFYVRTSGSEKLRVTSAGNVGIGTSSPYADLHVTGTIKAATGNAQGILGLGEGNGSTVNVGLWRGAANAPTTDGNYLNLGGYDGIVFATGAAAIGSQTERMRIDASGNLLVGTTDSIPWNNSAGSSADNGFAYRPEGILSVAGYNTQTLLLNRTGTDGDIVEFRKNGTTVGSIGSRSSVVSYIVLDPRSGVKGAALIGGSIDANTGIINPGKNDGDIADAAIDLGSTGARFKDLYLSGGVYVGGTGSANYLDDYEEGTWVPVCSGATLDTDYASGGTFQSTYTKIGRMVSLEFNIKFSSITSGNNLNFSGLPFSSKGGIWGGDLWTNGWSSEPGHVRFWANSSTLNFYKSNGSGGVTALTQGDIGTGGNMFGFLTYFTS